MPGNCPHYGRWPQHGFTSLKKLRPQSVTSRIQPGSDVIVCAEMDEQWGYVGAKSRQRWLFYAYDRIRRTVVAHVFGERTLATLARLLSLLSAFEVVVWMTDGWPLYESRLKGNLVNATPVPQSSPMLPNAIICTLTAVPQERMYTVVTTISHIHGELLLTYR